MVLGTNDSLAIEPHIVDISTSPSHTGNLVKAAYGDVRLAPDSPLLVEVDEVGFVLQRSY